MGELVIPAFLRATCLFGVACLTSWLTIVEYLPASVGITFLTRAIAFHCPALLLKDLGDASWLPDDEDGIGVDDKIMEGQLSFLLFWA